MRNIIVFDMKKKITTDFDVSAKKNKNYIMNLIFFSFFYLLRVTKKIIIIGIMFFIHIFAMNCECFFNFNELRF